MRFPTLRRPPLGNARNFAFWIVLGLLVLALFQLVGGGQSTANSSEVSYSQFVDAIEGNEVANARVDGERVTYRGTDGRDYTTIMPRDAEVT